MALVMSRKHMQSVAVNGPCVVTVIKTRSGGVRLAIEAEPAVNIRRCELPDNQPKGTPCANT